MRGAGQRIAVAALLSFVTIIAIFLLPPIFRKDVVLVISTVIPTLYVGFAIQDGTPSKIRTQVIVATLFIAIALLAVMFKPILFGVGIILHAIWDYYHHTSRSSLRVQGWYPPFCATYDLILGVFLLFFMK